jgi:hypothetical protein
MVNIITKGSKMIIHYTPTRDICFSLNSGPDILGTGFIRNQSDFEFFAKVCGFMNKIETLESININGYPALHVVLSQTDLMMVFTPVVRVEIYPACHFGPTVGLRFQFAS